jgi:hypothetical protein
MRIMRATSCGKGHFPARGKWHGDSDLCTLLCYYQDAMKLEKSLFEKSKIAVSSVCQLPACAK